MIIRQIEPRDNAPLAGILRQVLTEFGANQPGFAWQDPALDQMYQVYQQPGSRYLVVEQLGQLVGGAGIGVLVGDQANTCELQKMYLLPEARGLGWGQALLQELLPWASQYYHYCYLETLASMTAANRLYQRQGFGRLDKPKGCTGHGGCDTWYGMPLLPQATKECLDD